MVQKRPLKTISAQVSSSCDPSFARRNRSETPIKIRKKHSNFRKMDHLEIQYPLFLIDFASKSGLDRPFSAFSHLTDFPCKHRFESLSGSFCEFSIQSCEITRHPRGEVEHGRNGLSGMRPAPKWPISGHLGAKILQRRRVRVNY